MATIKLAIAEDQTIVREGLISLLEKDQALKIVFEATNGNEVLEQLQNQKPDIILMDIEMPLMSGSEALVRVVAQYPNVKVILLSSYFIKPYIVKYIGMGARAYLPKDCGISKLLQTIKEVHQIGYSYDEDVKRMLDSEGTSRVETPVTNLKFSPTELDIIKLVCKGKVSKEIAEALSLSPRTIEWYRDKIKKLTGCVNNTELIRFAIKHKLNSD